MKIIYNHNDMISFASYVLSDERKEMFMSMKSEEEDTEDVEARMKYVWHSDIENWRTGRKMEE